MKVLDLFSGIGGFSLGLERAGMKTVAFCEIDSFCRRVLAKHWPEVPCYDDVRELTVDRLRADGIEPSVICGGFPCQDISDAGARAGIDGARSGLWSEYARLIGEVRPRYVIVENVAALLGRGLDRVLGDLAALRYDAEWHCIPAAAVGAPHRRDRVWIVAHPDDQGEHAEPVDAAVARASQHVADAKRARLEGRAIFGGHLAAELKALERGRALLADADGEGRDEPIGAGGTLSGAGAREPAGPDGGRRHPWLFEPDVGRVADGVPARMDRLRSLGNAVVPQIPEAIGRAIMKVELANA